MNNARRFSSLSFQLSPANLDIQALARKFAREEILPQAAHLDKTGTYPTELLAQMHRLGLTNTHVPEDCGGPGMDLLTGGLISQELAYACSGVSTAAEANGLATAPLLIGASDELKKKYLSRLTEDGLMAAYCVTEPTGGSDVAGLKTKAVKDGDEWVLSGNKMWITNGGVANWYFVLARTDDDPNAPAGQAFTGFVVERDSKGITVGRKELNMGQRCSDTRAVTFDEVRVPDANRLGKGGDGFKIAMKAFDLTRPLIGAAATGLATRCLDEATRYAKERRSFGQPLIQHQAVQFALADMAIGVESSLLAWQRAAWEMDQGRSNTYYASVAKVLGSETAVSAANEALQIFGGNGYNSEYPMEKLYRDAKIFMIYEGPNAIQRIILGRHIAERFGQ